MQTNQSRAHIPPPPPLSSSHSSLGHYSSALITRGPGILQLKTAPVPQSLLKLFKLANPKPAYPAWPIPSHGNHIDGSAHLSHCSFCLHYNGAFPRAPPPFVVWHPPFWGESVSIKKLSFQGQLSLDLLASPHLTNNKICILKHSPTPALRPHPKAAISYLQMVMARVDRTPVKDGKKSKKMKKVIICEARQALLGGWKFIIRLIWKERSSPLPSESRQRDPSKT